MGCSCNCSTDDSGVGRRSDSMAFIVERGDYSDIYVAHTGDSNRERLTFDDTEKRELSWSPDGSMLIFTSRIGGDQFYDREVYVMSSDGLNLVSLGRGSQPGWSPDGSKILYSLDRRLYIMNPDGTDKKELVYGDGDSWAQGRVWSPDRSRIAYRMWRPSGARSEIWVMNADGSGQMRVGSAPIKYGVSSFVWSPDGSKITYICSDTFWMYSSDSRYEAGPTKIYTVNADGTDLVEVCNIPSDFWGEEALSPDGDKVAYGFEGDIWVANSDGTNQTKLTSGWAPKWSSDGTQIAYRLDGDIWVMNADGTNQIKAIDDSQDYLQFAWSP